MIYDNISYTNLPSWDCRTDTRDAGYNIHYSKKTDNKLGSSVSCDVHRWLRYRPDLYKSSVVVDPVICGNKRNILSVNNTLQSKIKKLFKKKKNK